ncbi:MAG: DUF2256 domain-containing protein [Planctomycetota bacterium]
MAHKKVNLPTKRCPCCGRLFTYRKKWRSCWDEVRYCSQRCRSNRTTAVKDAR